MNPEPQQHLDDLRQELQSLRNDEKAQILQRYFKTGKGEYGEGDVFLGLTVPVQRKLAKKYATCALNDLPELLHSPIHEERLVGFLILVGKYEKAAEKEELFDFYLANRAGLNNWDLVDSTSHKIVGDFLIDRERDILYELARSENLWERRIAVISCFAFIRNDDFADILKIAEMLLNDSEDLIHKAAGWMLRETGKRNEAVLEDFLNEHHLSMPRTMLRYSIEKLSKDQKRRYMKRQGKPQ